MYSANKLHTGIIDARETIATTMVEKCRRETRRIKNRIYANPTHLWIVILDYSAHVATRYVTRVKSPLLHAVYIE